MPELLVSESGNRLLDDLPPEEFRRIMANSTLVNLKSGQIVYENDRIISQVYFPLTASISNVAKVSSHPPIGIVQIGNEGMLGATLILGVKVAPLRAVVHGPGIALRMDVASFHIALRKNPSLRLVIGRYLYVLLEQLSRTAACNRFHNVETRLVRWLLLTHDRANADHFHLTHQTLADMLGVLRSAVTIAAGNLQQKNLISYSRGEITIIDRAGLEAICCECYEVVIADYKRLIV